MPVNGCASFLLSLPPFAARETKQSLRHEVCPPIGPREDVGRVIPPDTDQGLQRVVVDDRRRAAVQSYARRRLLQEMSLAVYEPEDLHLPGVQVRRADVGDDLELGGEALGQAAADS